MASLLDQNQGGRISLFEANPIVARFLNHSVYENGLQDRAQVYNYAIYNETKKLDFLIYLRSYRSHIDYRSDKTIREGVGVKEEDTIVPVLAVRLDDLFPPEILPQVNLIKMDIEASEPLALLGAINIIQRSPDIILILE